MCEHTYARTTLCHLFFFSFFFEVDVSLNRGHQSWGLVFFHAYGATKPHPGVLVPWNSAGCLKVARVTAFAARKQRDLSCTEGPNTSSRSVTFILLQNHCASGTSEHPTSPLFSLQIVVILGQQGAAENERGEFCRQSWTEHIKRLLFGMAPCFSHSLRLAPLFCAWNLPFPSTYAWL